MISESQSQLMEVMESEFTNIHGNVQSGKRMKILDRIAFIVASRYAHSNGVTATADGFDFLSPVFVGNVVHAMKTRTRK